MDLKWSKALLTPSSRVAISRVGVIVPYPLELSLLLELELEARVRGYKTGEGLGER